MSGWPASQIRSFDPEKRQEGLLGYVHGPHALHPLLAFLLFLEELALARDVPAVAFRQDVLPQRLHVRARDDLRADGRLDRDLELLAGNQLLHLDRELLASPERLVAVDDERKRVHGLAVDQDVELDEVS